MIKNILSVFIFAFFLAPCVVRAENFRYSEAEKAVFTFNKLIRGEPDYERWILASPEFKTLDAAARAEKLEQELLRLKWGFGTFDKDRDFLRINSAIMLTLSESAEGPILRFAFPKSEKEEIPYFPYSYGADWIALVIYNMGDYVKIELTAEEAQHIKQYFAKGGIYPAMLNIRVRGVSADGKAPLKLDGVNQWLMAGEIGYIEFTIKDSTTQENITIWKLTAPWYLTDTEKLLMPLLEEPAAAATRVITPVH